MTKIKASLVLNNTTNTLVLKLHFNQVEQVAILADIKDNNVLK